MRWLVPLALGAIVVDAVVKSEARSTAARAQLLDAHDDAMVDAERSRVRRSYERSAAARETRRKTALNELSRVSADPRWASELDRLRRDQRSGGK